MTKKELEQEVIYLKDRLERLSKDNAALINFKQSITYIATKSYMGNELNFIKEELQKMKLKAQKWEMLKGHINDLERHLDD